MIIKAILCDFARVILLPKDKTYMGRLDKLYLTLLRKLGKYDVFDYFDLNGELLHFLKKLKAKYSLNIFTTGKTQDDPKIKKKLTPLFDHIFVTSDYGIDKTDPNSYQYIANLLKVKPEEIVFIDDLDENIHAAKETGIYAIQYFDNQKLFTQLNNFVWLNGSN